MENKRYNLIKEYPGSYSLGCYVIIEGRTAILYNNKGHIINKSFGTYWIEDKKYSEFWEEVPEYARCIIKNYYYGELNKIYKVINWNYSTNDCLLEGTNTGSTDRKRFTSSTKEEYEAQNKSKVEDTKVDFILPKKWCIKRTLSNYDTINKFFNSKVPIGSHNKFSEKEYYITSDHIGIEIWITTLSRHPGEKYTEITFEQFEKYVLNKNVEIFTQSQLELINKMIDDKIKDLV